RRPWNSPPIVTRAGLPQEQKLPKQRLNLRQPRLKQSTWVSNELNSSTRSLCWWASRHRTSQPKRRQSRCVFRRFQWDYRLNSSNGGRTLPPPNGEWLQPTLRSELPRRLTFRC